jgi:hypothetical protein
MALSSSLSDAALKIDGILITDHNRATLEVSTDRIETRRRMANGTLRINFIGNKTKISTSWDMVPSLDAKTVDGNKGAAYLKNLYDTKGATPMTVVVTFKNGSTGDTTTITKTMVFASFDYNVVKRGTTFGSATHAGFDLVNMSLALEEV